MKENVDGITKIWTPSVEECQQSHDYRAANEWMRKKKGISGIRPTYLGIESYRWGKQLPAKFYEGRNPPPVAQDSLENIEWYTEQLERCVYGFEYQGHRVTGDHYWFLNFTPFSVVKKDKVGMITTDFEITFPYYALMHDYLFKTIEEAHYEQKGFALMGGRGFGKTYAILSILAKIYHLKPASHSIVSASSSNHAGESFNKLKLMLDSIADAHPTIALARLQDTKFIIEAGQEVVRDGVKTKEGSRSRLQQVIYGDNPGATRGGRPDAQLFEEMGDWSTGKGDLKSCIGATIGSWRVGSIQKCRYFLIGTGGSVASDQAKDVFTNCDAYGLLEIRDFKPKSCFFMPSDYMLGGKGWEETAVNDNVSARAWLEEERERTKDDMEIHTKIVQEYPLTIDEAFRKMGTNIFNQKNIARQWSLINMGDDTIQKPEKGFLDWVRTPSGTIKGVKWSKNPEGNIEIVEHPYRGQSGKDSFTNLYVGGVDSIDMGEGDSTSVKNRSLLACLIKKRIVDGHFFKQTSNIYVAKYLGRSFDVRSDYEEVLKLSMYYNAKLNVEYTRIGIVAYFKECKKYHMLLKRPTIALPSGGTVSNNAYLQMKQSNLIGSPATPHVINHQDEKVKDYTNDYCYSIFFTDLLEQLRDYQREDRKRYDLVIAMGLCELADEDLLGEGGQQDQQESRELELFGYYSDQDGVKRFGILPQTSPEKAMLEQGPKDPVRWIDASNKVRFDDNFHISEIEELHNL